MDVIMRRRGQVCVVKYQAHETIMSHSLVLNNVNKVTCLDTHRMPSRQASVYTKSAYSNIYASENPPRQNDES